MPLVFTRVIAQEKDASSVSADDDDGLEIEDDPVPAMAMGARKNNKMRGIEQIINSEDEENNNWVERLHRSLNTLAKE